jgi:hypothetical protein
MVILDRLEGHQYSSQPSQEGYPVQARSSGVEHHLDMVGVGGSKPPEPTILDTAFAVRGPALGTIRRGVGSAHEYSTARRFFPHPS